MSDYRGHRPVVAAVHRYSGGYPITAMFLLAMLVATSVISLVLWRSP